MSELIGGASHGVVLGNFGLSAIIYFNFCDHSISVRICANRRKLSWGVQIKIHGSEGSAFKYTCIRLMLLTPDMRIPWGELAGTGCPQTPYTTHVDIL